MVKMDIKSKDDINEIYEISKDYGLPFETVEDVWSDSFDFSEFHDKLISLTKND